MKNYPDWRFNFSDDWQEKKLRNVCHYVDYRGKTPQKVDNGIFLVTAKNIRMGYIDYDCSKEFVKQDEYDEIMHRGYPKIGDVLITTEAPCGNIAVIDRDDIALAQRVIKYSSKNKNNLNNKYLSYELMSPTFQKILSSKATGGTSQGIKGEVLHELKIKIPCIEEQKKISDYLTHFDKALTAQEKKVTNWREVKKGMLQKIFSREFRFKDDNGNDYPDWQDKKLGDLISIPISNGVFCDPKKKGTGKKIINVINLYNDFVIDEDSRIIKYRRKRI